MMNRQLGVCLLLLLVAVCSQAKPHPRKAKGHHIRAKYFHKDPLLPQEESTEKTEDKDNTLETKTQIKPTDRTSKSYSKWARPSDQWLAWNPVSEKKPAASDTNNSPQDSQTLPNDTNDVDTPISDPCGNVYCHYGRVCHVTSEGKGECSCAGKDYCRGHEKKVCGSDGKWYDSHCELHRQACLKSAHIGIDHTGAICKDAKPDAQVEVSASLEYIDPDQTRSEKMTEEQQQQQQQQQQELESKEDSEEDAEDGSDAEDSDEDEFEEEDDEVEDGEKELDTEDEEPEDYAQVNVCTELGFGELKSNLLAFHCDRIDEIECQADPHKLQFLVNIMFSYYDLDNSERLTENELETIEHRDHLEKLSMSCSLVDLLSFDDTDDDGNITADEFYVAFNVPTVSLPQDLRVFTTQVVVGNSIELKCNIEGSSDITWKRNGAFLDDITTDDIKVFEDGSLYIKNLGLHHMANYTCQDRYNPRVVQTHVLRVLAPPKVRVSPITQFHTTGSSVILQCYVGGVPEPASVEWEMNETPLPDDPEALHYLLMHNNSTLELRTATYTKDTGAYKCKAKNTAGSAQDIATVFIENSDVPKYSDSSLDDYEIFVVFHDQGYTVYEPARCHIEHMVTGAFSNFKVLPDFGNTAETLCAKGQECDWGKAVNVHDKYVYITQPSLSRVVVVDMHDRANPVEVITTDHVPVAVHYVEHLDQVWVTCWNREEDTGSKTAIIIRQASQPQQHHTVHTQPIGNRFDLIQDIFLPPHNDLDHHFEYGYVTHQDQQGLYKLDLRAMKYVRNINLEEYACIPKSVVFVPLGGQVIIHCSTPADEPRHAVRLVLDYVTDRVLEHTELEGEPHLSPDGRYLVLINNNDDSFSVSRVADDGKLSHQFDGYANMHVSSVTFFPSERGRSYDFYAASADKNQVLYMNLASGKVKMIDGVGEAAKDNTPVWKKKDRPITSAGVFGHFLMTPSENAVVVIDGKRQHVQCEWQDVPHGDVIVWVEPKHV